MFSATFPPPIQRAAGEFLNEYVFIVIGVVGGACRDVKQEFMEVQRKDKRGKILEILGSLGTNDKAFVFCGSKMGVDFLAATLASINMSCASMHDERPQSQREQAIREFTTGERQILVATAVAARGLGKN